MQTQNDERIYLCIDLRSFFASVECVARDLDPLKTNLVVADPARGSGAICLAITPAMKQLGIRNRCRVYEIPEKVKYITAKPRMKRYMEVSADIYSVYLKYVSPEDIHVYSIDECFIDATTYLKLYEKTPREMAVMLMRAVFDQTGISASAGIGTNMFLAKVALDITAKHTDDHIGYLDKNSFEKQIWHHRPITDVWNVGRGIAARLEKYGVFDLYGLSRLSEQTLYSEFGVNALFLIDHAKGEESCTIKDIHEYRPKSNSLSNGQILFENYSYTDALLVLKEMVDMLTLELVEKHLVTDSISLYVGYANETGKGDGSTKKISGYTNSAKKLMRCFEELYALKVKRNAPIRRINIGFNNIVEESFSSMDFFTDLIEEQKERDMQNALITIKNKYGKDAVLKGMDLKQKATRQIRNKLIGGHNGE